jgi:hypothetical protein
MVTEILDDSMKNVVFWNVAQCRYCVNRRSSETSVYRISSQLLVPVPRSRIFIEYPTYGGDTFLRHVGLHNIQLPVHSGPSLADFYLIPWRLRRYVLRNVCLHNIHPPVHAGSSLANFYSITWKWRRYVPPKRRFTQYVHGPTSQKTAFFIVTAVKTSNPTQMTQYS